MTPEQVEALLRRVGPQLPVQPVLDAARAAQIREQVAQLAGNEIRRPPAASLAFARWMLSAAAGLALALIWFAAPRSLPEHELAFDVDVGASPVELFRVQRSGLASRSAGDVFVGVRTNRDAFVRLLARNRLDQIESLPLDRRGETTLSVRGGAAMAFGGYSIEDADAGRDSRLTHIIVLCSADRVSDGQLQEAMCVLPTERPDATFGAVNEWAKRLGARIDASAQVREIRFAR